MTESVHKLTEPWTLVLTPREAGEYRAQDFPPLLDMLAGLVTPNSGRTRGGVNDPSTRSVVDVKALDLLVGIQDVVGAWSVEFRVQGFTGLSLVTQTARVAAAIDTAWRTGQLLEHDYTRRLNMFDRWAAQVWDLVEPPLTVPLREATCPECGRSKWANENDEWVDNLLVSFRDGGDVQAECRWVSCTFLAVGPRALRDLGFHVGATVDDDTLKEMGVSW
jgi:hypothetical protein